MNLKIKLFARNIVNPEVITDFITEVSKGQSDKIKVWCNTILKNYLKNEYDNLKDVTKSKKTDPVWLQEAVKRKDAQKIIIDKDFERLLIEHIFHYFDTLQGNNIKHSFSEAEKQTKEWENKENLFNIKLAKGVKEILKCDKGYTWFEIVDEETLYNEGEVLQNCMRKKEHGLNYWKFIKKKSIKIFTLRDNKGIGHVGVEYNTKLNKIEQMLGKQNDDPIEIYHSSCIELIKYLKCEIIASITKLLKVVVVNNDVYDIFNLPSNLKVTGNWYFNAIPITTLPDGLWVTGDLLLWDTEIKKLTNSLRVDGNLNLQSSKITQLPDKLIVGGNLNLRASKIKKLPKNLKVVGGSLDVSDTSISELPKNLYVTKDLYADYTKLVKLPNNFKVGKSLNISNSLITKLPEGLVIGGSLDLINTKITELPEDLKVKYRIFVSKDMEIKCNSKLALKIYRQ